MHYLPQLGLEGLLQRPTKIVYVPQSKQTSLRSCFVFFPAHFIGIRLATQLLLQTNLYLTSIPYLYTLLPTSSLLLSLLLSPLVLICFALPVSLSIRTTAQRHPCVTVLPQHSPALDERCVPKVRETCNLKTLPTTPKV